MFYFLAILVSLALIYGFVIWLSRVEIGEVKSALKVLLPATIFGFAIASAVAGRPAFGAFAALVSVAIVWRSKRASEARILKTAAVMRSPWLEVSFGTTKSGMNGVVLAGRREGRALSSLNEAELIELYVALKSDQESRELLEAYLDGHAPVWRDNPQFDIDLGQGIAPRTGAMADEEAYQILGLEAGASAADIRKAHRSLSQRMRSNAGSLLLLSRIDEARDILLARHH